MRKIKLPYNYLLMAFGDGQSTAGLVPKLREVNFPVAFAIKLRRNIKALEEFYEDLQEQRLELLKKYGEEVSEGAYSISPFLPSKTDKREKNPNWEPFQNEYNTLITTEFEIELQDLSVEDAGDKDIPYDVALILEPLL